VANTLAYYDTATITAEKTFIVQTPEHFVAILGISYNKRLVDAVRSSIILTIILSILPLLLPVTGCETLTFDYESIILPLVLQGYNQ
jgi:hypothetical protein